MGSPFQLYFLFLGLSSLKVNIHFHCFRLTLVELPQCWWVGCIKIDTEPEQRRSITGRLRCISQEGGQAASFDPHTERHRPIKTLFCLPLGGPHLRPQIANPITGKWSMQRQKTHQTTFILCLHPDKNAFLDTQVSLAPTHVSW